MLFLMIFKAFWCDSGARGVWVGVGLVGALVGPEGFCCWFFIGAGASGARLFHHIGAFNKYFGTYRYLLFCYFWYLLLSRGIAVA